MLSNLITAVVVMMLFGVTIFVHELGHFLVARWCGLVVDAFSIGFGPALWKRKINGVEYKLGLLPLGGYVALPQLDPTAGNPHKEEGKEKDKPAPRDLPPVTPFKKILVSLAGVTGNMILALGLAWVVFVVGKPSAPHEVNTIVGYVDATNAAYAAGLRVADEIVAVNGRPVRNWEEIVFHMTLSNTGVAMAARSPAGEEKNIAVPTEKGLLGVWSVPGVSWMNYVSVASVVAGSSAEQAGLKPGDLLLELNGVKLYSREQLVDLVDQHRDQEMPCQVRRGKDTILTKVKPAYDQKLDRALIGIIFNTMYVDHQAISHPRPLTQIRYHADSVFRFLGALVTPKQAARASQAMGGPLSVIIMIWLTVKSSYILALWFTGFFNVNLAILNLLPIPVLDGGHIMISLWELITRRRANAKVVNALWNVGFVLLLLLMLTLTWRDISRWVLPSFARNTNAPPAAVTNAPPAPP